MSQPWTVLAAIVAIALVYVLLPVFIETFLRFRAPKRLPCSVTGEDVEVRIDASHAAFTGAFVGHPRLRVGNCSLWPARRGCGEGCLTHTQ